MLTRFDSQTGGVPSVVKFLIAKGLMNGKTPTVTGFTLEENVSSAPVLDDKQDLIRPLENPILPRGPLRILHGNLAPGGAVAKITGNEGESFTGRAMVFDREENLYQRLVSGSIKPKENTVLVVRYEGPKGGPGMVSSCPSCQHFRVLLFRLSTFIPSVSSRANDKMLTRTTARNAQVQCRPHRSKSEQRRPHH